MITSEAFMRTNPPELPRCSSSNHPSGRDKANFRSVYIAIKGWAYRVNNPGSRLFIHFLKGHANRTEQSQVTSQLFLWHGARNIDRPDLNLAPIALFQD